MNRLEVVDQAGAEKADARAKRLLLFKRNYICCSRMFAAFGCVLTGVCAHWGVYSLGCVLTGVYAHWGVYSLGCVLTGICAAQEPMNQKLQLVQIQIQLGRRE